MNNNRVLPFELYKQHKTKTKNHWKKSGLNMENFEVIYDRYIYSTECDWCAINFKSRRDRCMDHCHKTGKFRGVLCNHCNYNANDCKNIGWWKQRNYYRVRIYRNKKYIFHKYCKTLEEAELTLKQFKDDNWWEFPWHIPNE
jgi:hypothetical protein